MNRPLIATLLAISSLLCQGAGRQVRSLDGDWFFIKGDTRPEAASPQWQRVTVPHDWAVAGPFDLNEDQQFVKVIEDGETEAHLRTGRTGALPSTGIGWYRRNISIPAADKGKRVVLEFDGVMSNARVYVNGQLAGERPYGYVSFNVDITPFVSFGGDNLVEVRAENPPEMSRFYTGAGIYRPVRLVTTGATHIAPWGISITTPRVTQREATVSIVTTVDSPDNATLTVAHDILDPDGNRVASAKKKITRSGDVAASCKVRDPRLWSPRNPSLYSVVTRVYRDGELVDSVTTVTGIRTIKFDNNLGFFLNGEPTKIKGVCLHHDLGPLGAAVNRTATRRQLVMMKKMGANAVRTAHNPPSLELLELCDSLGLMVQLEAFDEWREPKCINGYSSIFDRWAERDLTDIIMRDRNHPSIIMWSIGNEVREQNMADGGETARFLAEIARRTDPSRPVTAAFNHHDGAMANGLADAVDLVGFNYKPNDYASRHEAHPEYVIYGSETSSAVSSRGCYHFPVYDNWTPWHEDYQTSSYDMEYVPWGSAPDTEFQRQEENRFCLGEFVWTGFDYLGEPAPYGEGAPSRSSYFGIVDLAGFPKDRYYLYQSHWGDGPVLHVMPHWNWPDRIGQQVPVQCYTTWPEVELIVNGESKGIRRKNPDDKFLRYRMRWDDVIYQPGEIKVIARDENGNVADERVIRTAGAPARIELLPEQTTVKADGKDLAFIEARITDSEGNLCPRAASLLFVKVKGGELKALCNGDATDLTSFSSNYMKTFNGRMIIIVEPSATPGPITVQVSGERLGTTTCTVNSEK